MMTILLWALFALCLFFGFLGCFINKIPGPVAVVVATIIAITGLKIPISWGTVAIVAALAIASMIASKILVKMVKKIHEFSKRGSWGTTIGSIVGLGIMLKPCQGMDSLALILLLFVACLVLVPFVCALLLEFTNKQDTNTTFKCAIAATSAYLADTFLKLIVFAYATYVMFFK